MRRRRLLRPEALGDERPPAVIFVTAFDHTRCGRSRCTRSTPAEAVRPAAFQEAVRRAREQLRSRGEPDAPRRALIAAGGPKTGDKPLERLLVKSGRVFFLKVDEIDWSRPRGTTCGCTSGRRLLVRETMNDLESKLDSSRFLRIHRSTLVNLDRIKESTPGSRATTRVLTDGTQLKLSRAIETA